MNKDLTFSEFSKDALRTANKNLSDKQYLYNAAMGLCGESGEVIDHIKKHGYQGHELDTTKLVDELGDVLWYANLLAHSIGYDLETVALYNIAKRKERYPFGFSSENSKNR